MKTIPLTQGKVALVDDADYPILNQYKWQAYFDGNRWYTTRTIRTTEGKRRPLQMHRQIMGLNYKDGKEVDHIDDNGLNNQRSNLRITDHAHNMLNIKPRKGKLTKGVFWYKANQKFGAIIQVNKNTIWLGFSNSRKEAQECYNQACIKYHGQFAHIIDTTPILD